MPSPKRIALLNLPIIAERRVPLYSGIYRFINEGNPWEFVISCTSEPASLASLETIKWDGAIVRAIDPATCAWLKKMGKPTVNISALLQNTGIPTVRPDERAIGATAARHFIQSGIFRFALIRRRGNQWYQKARSEGFLETIHQAGYPCAQYNQQEALTSPEERGRLSEWIQGLRPNTGIFTSNDVNVQEIINICHQVGLKVPRDIALIGSTNNPKLMKLHSPTISTVQYDSTQLGYRAAQVLNEQFEGKLLTSETEEIKPDDVAQRDSTHIILYESAEIRQAIEFLQANFIRSLSVESIAEHIGMSRAKLYRLFVKEVQKTPHDYLQMLRVERAQELFLNAPEACLEDIAVNSGFSGRKHLNQAFLKKTGKTASEWRKQ